MASKRPPRTKEQSAAIRSSFAVGLAVAAYGLSFGALAVASGLDVWQTCVLSLFMFSGGSQFALIGVLASGGTSAGVAAIASAVLLGSRNGLYAIRVAPIVGPGWPKRFPRGALDDRREHRGRDRAAHARRGSARGSGGPGRSSTSAGTSPPWPVP